MRGTYQPVRHGEKKPAPVVVAPKKSFYASSGKNAGDHVAKWFKDNLRHIKGRWAGDPFELMPWQRDVIIRPLFGRKRRDGTRQYRTAYVEIPRKNGKSTLAAGIALYLLCADNEPGAEIYSAAADTDQARIVFNTARQMVAASPVLRGIAKPYRNAIVVEETGSVYRVLSADAFTKHGLNAHGIIFDELHAQPTRELWDVLNTSTGSRRQPLAVAITTAGYDRASICYEIHDYAQKVLAGVVDDPTFFAFVAAADEEDDWQSERTWRKANPGLGVTVSLDYLRQEAQRASEMPAAQNTFRRLHLNQWVQQSTRWLDLGLWDDNAGVQINESALHGRECFGGLDLSSVSDLTAWILLFPSSNDREELTILCRFWCPEARLHDTTNRYRDQYQAWARQGFLQTTPGNAVDYAFVRQQILKDAADFRIVDLSVDRLFQAHQISTELLNEGLNVVGVGMGFMSMAAPTKEFERRLLAHKIRHGDHPVLRWMVDNVAVRQDPAGNLKPDKANSQGKIDGIVATLLALDRAMRHEETTPVDFKTQAEVVPRSEPPRMWSGGEDPGSPWS